MLIMKMKKCVKVGGYSISCVWLIKTVILILIVCLLIIFLVTLLPVIKLSVLCLFLLPCYLLFYALASASNSVTCQTISFAFARCHKHFFVILWLCRD
jgi:hypothetical protein